MPKQKKSEQTYAERREIFDLTRDPKVVCPAILEAIRDKFNQNPDYVCLYGKDADEAVNWIAEVFSIMDDFCESPAESALLGAIVFMLSLERGLHLILTKPFTDTEVEIDRSIEMIEIYENLQERHSEELSDYRHNLYNHYEAIEAREVPVEFNKYIDFLVQNSELDTNLADELKGSWVSSIRFILRSTLVLTPQAVIKTPGGDYRVDMLFWFPRKPGVKIVVEVDGYEFHSDKKTFVSDRIRDRALNLNGYRVFRFSGSEVFSDLAAASVNVIILIMAMLVEADGPASPPSSENDNVSDKA